MEMLKVIDDLIQIGNDKGLKVVPEILLVISFTVLFFSPACLFFILYIRSFNINICILQALSVTKCNAKV
jgi:hypothetical protein